MREGLTVAAVVAASLGVVAVAGFHFLTHPDLQGAGLERAPGGEPDLEEGERLFFVGGCASCHATPDGGDPLRLGGGLAIATAFGTFVAPNISPSPDGIGGWTPAQFLRAMRGGVSPDGRHYYPSFPYTSYQRMPAEDVRDLHAYIMTLEPVAGVAPGHDIPFPWNVRRGIGLWKLATLDGRVFEPDPGASAELARGAYLVEGPGHCAECHSPRDAFGRLDETRRFAGGPNPHGRGFIPNITPHETGIGGWTPLEVVEVLTTGFTPDFDSVGGTMADVVENTARLPEEDRAAMAAYLLSLEPKPAAR